MTEPILCLVALAFLGWVLLLKAQIREMNNKINKLATKLDFDIDEKTGLAISGSTRSWGKKGEDHPLEHKH